ncbi:MAG: YjfB family protein [Azonexus sp.]|nr:YjfB family protein [Azonexus sp.]MCK6412172.1 YjfB family protein [Azonexus sp.]
MNVNSIAAMATSMSDTRVASEVATTVFKKALDVQEQTAMQLIAALPQAPNNPPHLGNGVDVRA